MKSRRWSLAMILPRQSSELHVTIAGIDINPARRARILGFQHRRSGRDFNELVDVIVKTGLQRFTPTTIVDLPVLQRNLDEARDRGYSIDQEEHVTGLNCIASAVYDDVGSVVAAISISGPASRLTPDRFVSQGELVRDSGDTGCVCRRRIPQLSGAVTRI